MPPYIPLGLQSLIAVGLHLYVPEYETLIGSNVLIGV
jgi:hypothetical protein